MMNFLVKGNVGINNVSNKLFQESKLTSVGRFILHFHKFYENMALVYLIGRSLMPVTLQLLLLLLLY